MTEKNKVTKPDNEEKNKSTKRRSSGVIPTTDLASKVEALSAQQEKQAEEALARAKQNVKEADIPARLPGDIQQQTR